MDGITYYLKKWRKYDQSKQNEEAANVPMSPVAGQRRTDREADSAVVPKKPRVSSGSQNLEAKRKTRASGGTSVPRDDGKPKKRVKSQLKPQPVPGVSIGNDVENIDSEGDSVEIIDDPGLWNTKAHSGSKIGTSTQRKKNERCSTSTSRENVGDGNKKISSARKEDECRNKELASGDAFLGDEDIRSDGPGPEMNLGVASCSRSKTPTFQKHPEVDEVSLDLSDEPPSSTGDDAQVDEYFNLESNNNVENLPKFPCSKVEDATMPKSRENEGTSCERNGIPEENTVLGNNVNEADETEIRENEEGTSHERNGIPEENPMLRNRGSSKHSDLFKKLADSVLEREPMLGKEDESNAVPMETFANLNQTSLPKKFRFEDEVPKQVEKTDIEKEREDMWAESFFSESIGMESFNHSKVGQKCESSHVGETEDLPCEHEFVLRDDEGKICRKCDHVAVAAKDIIPDWAEKPPRESNKERSLRREEDRSQFDELHLPYSTNNNTAFNCNNGTVWNIKSGVRETMYKHQQEGFEFLWMNLAGSINLADLKSSIVPSTDVGGCIISHAPGTGKTRLTIVFIETYLKVFPNCRPVIVAPASMLLTWEEEFKKWNVGFPFHNLNNPGITGNKESGNSLGHLAGGKGNMDITRMIKIHSWNKGGSILGISYSLCEKLTGKTCTKGKKSKQKSADDKFKDLREILLEKPGLVVMDEGHTPRNQNSNIWKVLVKLNTAKRVILSGTPFQNNFSELFNTLRLVRPGVADVLEKDKAFSAMISSKGKKKSDARDSQSASDSESMASAVKKLKEVMSPFVHVHKGTILQESLPGLRDTVVILKPSGLQKSLIEAQEKRAVSLNSDYPVALMSVHPYLFNYRDAKNQGLGIKLDAVEASMLNPNDGVKTKFVLELVRHSLAMHEKVLIFSQYIQPLELIKVLLSKVFSWIEGKQILQMNGKVDQKQRQMLLNAFNDPQNEAKVMLGSTKCCSEGISLVGASRVVLLDVVWNPSVERQAISRAYRIGQKKFVHTYHLMTAGTSEFDKYCMKVEKERLSELVFCSSSNESQERIAAVTEDRILEAMVSHVKLKDMFERIINQPTNQRKLT